MFVMKKNLLIFPILIAINLILFVAFVKVAKNNNKTTTKISVVVFDPVSEFFIKQLSYNTNSIEVTNVLSYLNKTEKLSFYEQNKIRTSNAVIAFDPNGKIQKALNIEKNKLFDFSASIIYYDDFFTAGNIDELMSYGYLNSSKNLKFLLIYLTSVLKNLDPVNKAIYESNFFELSKQISTTFTQATQILQPFTERAINIIIVGSQATQFLQDINFFGVVDIASPITQEKTNNLKNIIKSGGVGCVVNIDLENNSEIYKAIKIRPVKYYRYNLYNNFSLQNYIKFTEIVSKCFDKK